MPPYSGSPKSSHQLAGPAGVGVAAVGVGVGVAAVGVGDVSVPSQPARIKELINKHIKENVSNLPFTFALPNH